MHDDFTSKQTEPIIQSSDPLRVYYKQITSNFTRNVYIMIAKENADQHLYTIIVSDHAFGYQVFRLARFCFSNIRHQVRYYFANTYLCCSCLLYESDGIPCRHIFVVMKHLNINRIPTYETSLVQRCKSCCSSGYNTIRHPSQRPRDCTFGNTCIRLQLSGPLCFKVRRHICSSSPTNKWDDWTIS